MPSQRKRIGFLPSEEVHEIIDKLCRASEFSQSKVTGILVEEALRSRGLFRDTFNINENDKTNFINYSLEKETSFIYKARDKSDDFKVNKRVFSEDIKMMHEFIEFKYFKKVMKQNNNFFEL